MRFFVVGAVVVGAMISSVSLANAGELDIEAAHTQFVEAFNARDWSGLRQQMSEDIVFHRANGDQVHIGQDAVSARFSETIGNPEQWNVKFAVLKSTSSHRGKDGRVVERGDFGVTAGADDPACYAGSYLMTWTVDRKLQMLAWQDVESEMAACGK